MHNNTFIITYHTNMPFRLKMECKYLVPLILNVEVRSNLICYISIQCFDILGLRAVRHFETELLNVVLSKI